MLPKRKINKRIKIEDLKSSGKKGLHLWRETTAVKIMSLS
jgi:hypothetical protein